MKFTLHLLLAFGFFSPLLISCKKGVGVPGTCGNMSKEPSVDPDLGGTTGDLAVDKFVKKVNDYREANGKKRLIWNSTLQTAATAHLADLNAHNIFSHTGSTGDSPLDRVKATGLVIKSIAENILAIDIDVDDNTSAQNALDGWRVSPEHDATILDLGDVGYTYHAVAKLNDANGGTGVCPAPTSVPCDLWIEVFLDTGCKP